MKLYCDRPIETQKDVDEVLSELNMETSDVTFTGNYLTGEHIIQILKALKRWSPNIQRLSIQFNYAFATNNVLYFFCKIVPSLQHIKYIDLTGNKLSERQILGIMSVLTSQSERLRYIDFSWNDNLSDFFFIEIGRMLKKSFIQTFYFSGHNITEKGATAFAQMIPSTKLRYISSTVTKKFGILHTTILQNQKRWGRGCKYTTLEV